MHLFFIIIIYWLHYFVCAGNLFRLGRANTSARRYHRPVDVDQIVASRRRVSLCQLFRIAAPLANRLRPGRTVTSACRRLQPNCVIALVRCPMLVTPRLSFINLLGQRLQCHLATCSANLVGLGVSPHHSEMSNSLLGRAMSPLRNAELFASLSLDRLGGWDLVPHQAWTASSMPSTLTS